MSSEFCDPCKELNVDLPSWSWHARTVEVVALSLLMGLAAMCVCVMAAFEMHGVLKRREVHGHG